MEPKPLDRSVDIYRSVLITWLETPNLNQNEVALIQAMLNGLEKSLIEFDQLRRIATQPAFFPHLKSAAAKAMAAGKLKSWSEHLAAQA
jgi:hypothetical protein